MGIISYRVRSPGDSCLVTGGGELGWGLWRVSDGAMQLCRVCVCVRMSASLLYHTVS